MKNTAKTTLTIIVVIMLNVSNILASGIDKLMKYATPDGAMSNVNKAAIINDQQGGYMTGGSILLRGPKPKTLQPLILQTPKFAYDACTGSADFRFGGLSYISAKEFTQFFKNTATAAGSYAVKMFIKSACPQCEDIMSYLETVARDINGMMIDQCSMGQAIGGGIYNSLTSGNQQKCMMQGNIDKSSRDMYEATDKCKTNPERHGAKGEEDELKSLLGNEFNLVWKAMGKGKGGDLDFKELIMSVSGTIIGRKIDGSFHFSNKPSLVLSNDLLEQYIGINKKTGKVKIYQCDNKDKCLEPSEVEIVLEAKDTIYGNMTRILTGLVPKILANKDVLTDEEQAVIAFSTIPIIQLIEMEIVHKAKTEDMIVRMDEFIQVVCYDVVTNFLTQMVTQATASVQALEYAQLDNSIINNFTEQANQVRQFITDAKFAAFKRLQVITQVKERLTQQQRAFKAGFGRFIEYNTQG
jgi:conjugative transfer pilus assembly protein TraH